MKQTRGRAGRPSLAQAGEVESRILDAAARVFLERGFVGATYDQIAEAAQAGKATLYARYPGKEALFSAVIRRKVDRTMHLAGELPAGLGINERLRLTMLAILTNVLSAEVIALMRVVIAGTPQFPALGRLVDEYARQRTTGTLAALLKEASPPPGRAVEAVPPPDVLGRLLLDLTLAPLVLRALMGEHLAMLQDEIPEQIESALSLMRAAGTIV